MGGCWLGYQSGGLNKSRVCETVNDTLEPGTCLTELSGAGGWAPGTAGGFTAKAQAGVVCRTGAEPFCAHKAAAIQTEIPRNAGFISRSFSVAWIRLALLRVQFLAERLLAIVDISAVTGGIDEGVGRALPQLRVFGGHAVIIAVRAQEDVAGQGAKHFETVFVIGGDPRIVLVAHQHKTRIYVQASDDDYVVGLAAVLHLHGPGGAALGVAGSEMGYQRGSAQSDFIAIVQDAVDGMGLAARGHFAERGNVLLHGHDARAGQLFYQRVAFHVIPVSVTAQQDFDIAEAETELFYRSANDGHGLLEIAVDEDVSLRSNHQVGSKLFRPHVVQVARDFVRRERLAPFDGSGTLPVRQRRGRENASGRHPSRVHNGKTVYVFREVCKGSRDIFDFAGDRHGNGCCGTAEAA